MKVLLLGSGELGKEVCIELMRLGVEVVACDRYERAPAMQVAHRFHVFSMLNAEKLRSVVESEKPDLIVPEIEAIATDELVKLEQEGWKVIPTAEAALLTMNREGIRNLAARELELPTARYEYADSLSELQTAAEKLGFPCVIKPIMSSSGKGQSIARDVNDLEKCWEYSQTGGRTAQATRIIVEAFIPFESEITLLTVRASNGTFFCDPIGHKQKDGDYIESWQPHAMNSEQIKKAQTIAKKVTDRLGGYGIFGVELFLLKNGDVYFSEVSPRPHDTGMVTMATQDWSEFALHARAILGYPIAQIRRHAVGASVAIRAQENISSPQYSGQKEAFSLSDVDLRIFGKPESHPKRRMAVALAIGDSVEQALRKARAAAEKIVLS